MENARIIVATITELVNYFPATIEEDNTRIATKTQADRTKAMSSKQLRGNSAKEIIRAFKTSAPIAKILSLDPTLCEYLLYTLLTIATHIRS